eukprot:3539953-Amphidinium_carterae.1
MREDLQFGVTQAAPEAMRPWCGEQVVHPRTASMSDGLVSTVLVVVRWNSHAHNLTWPSSLNNEHDSGMIAHQELHARQQRHSWTTSSVLSRNGQSRSTTKAKPFSWVFLSWGNWIGWKLDQFGMALPNCGLLLSVCMVRNEIVCAKDFFKCILEAAALPMADFAKRDRSQPHILRIA